MVAAAQLFDESRIILQGSDTLLVNRAFHVVNNGNETATCEVDFFFFFFFYRRERTTHDLR